jgi:hypothetical protein
MSDLVRPSDRRSIATPVAIVIAAACFTSLVSCQYTATHAAPVPVIASASTSSHPPAEPSSLFSPAPAGNLDTVSLAAIQRLNAEVGFVSGWTATGFGLAKTADGGATWQQVAIPASRINALRFVDADAGWAAGIVQWEVPQVACHQAAPSGARPCYGVVLRTEDGGQTWNTVLSVVTDGVQGDAVRQLEAIDGRRAWVLTLAPPPCRPANSPAMDFACPTELRRTTDGGKTWTVLLHAGIAAIRFASASRGWLATVDSTGTVSVRVTSDGGTTWTEGLRTAGGEVLALDAASSQTAWLMMRDGAYCTASTCTKYDLFRTSDGGLSWASLGNPKDSAAGCSIGQLVGPLFASPTLGWLALNLGAGGVQGTGGLLTTGDGGRTWRCASGLPNTYLVTAADPLHVWVTSVQRGSGATTLYSSDDAGGTWHPLDLRALR